MALLWILLLTAPSLVICFSEDSYVSPEETAVLLFNGVDFLHPCPNATTSPQNRLTVKKNIIATSMQIWKNQLLATFPRYKCGVPVTAASTDLIKNKKCNPEWMPLPCWEQQNIGICDSIQSAVDIVVLEDRAWILDSGYLGGLNGTQQLCPPKVVAVGLNTNTVQQHVDFSAFTCPTSRLQYLAVEQTPSGRTYVYVSDASNRAILVWDILHARGFRVVLPEEVLGGCQKNTRDVLYLFLVNLPDGSSSLVFTYLSSCVMFSIQTEFLRQASTTGRVVARGLKPGKMVLLGTDGGPGVYFRYSGRPEVYMWDTTLPFLAENFVKVYAGQKYRMATSVAPDYARKRMLVLESNFPDFVDGCVGEGVSHTVTDITRKVELRQKKFQAPFTKNLEQKKHKLESLKKHKSEEGGQMLIL